MSPYHNVHSQNQQSTPQTSPFPETMEWEGESLILVFNPYDQTRSQMRPDYSRLIGDHGDCYPVSFVNANGETIQKWVVFVKLTCPAEPGTLIPQQQFYAFRLYDVPVSSSAVDWRTLIFYGIKPKEQQLQANEGQRFLNTLLGLDKIQPMPEPQDDKWTEDFAGLQQQLARPNVNQPMTEPSSEEEDD